MEALGGFANILGKTQWRHIKRFEAEQTPLASFCGKEESLFSLWFVFLGVRPQTLVGHVSAHSNDYRAKCELVVYNVAQRADLFGEVGVVVLVELGSPLLLSLSTFLIQK